MSAGNGPDDVDALPARVVDRRRHHRRLFAPKEPVLAGMRIETGDGQAGRCDTEARERFGSNPDHAEQPRPGQIVRHERERDMDGREHDLEPLGPEHHHDVVDTAEMREQVGVAAPRQTGGRKGLLVDRRRDDGIDVCRKRIRRRADDRLVGRARRAGVDAASRKLRDFFGQMRTVDHRPTDRRDARIANRFERDLRADAGGITGGDGDQRQGISKADTRARSRQMLTASQSATIFGLALRSRASWAQVDRGVARR